MMMGFDVNWRGFHCHGKLIIESIVKPCGKLGATN